MIVHHLNCWANFVDERLDEFNGIVLCHNCHDVGRPDSFHTLYGNRNSIREQFEEYLGHPIPINSEEAIEYLFPSI